MAKKTKKNKADPGKVIDISLKPLIGVEADRKLNDETLTKNGKFMVAITLTDAELATKMIKVVALNKEIRELTRKKKERVASINEEIKAKTKSLSLIDEMVDAGYEKRMVEAIEERDYAENEVRYIIDGRVVESRLMTTDEAQLRIEMQARKVVNPTAKRKFPGNGKDPADFKKAAAGDKDDDDEDLTAHIRAETSKKSKHSSVDGPRDA